MAVDKSGVKAVWAAPLWNTPKRCELQLFLAAIRQAVWRLKALDFGRLMAFKKCTAGVASSKGRQSLESWRLMVWEKQYFTRVLTYSDLFKPFNIFSHLFRPVDTCSHVFTPQWLRSSPNGSFCLNFTLAKTVILQSYVIPCWNCILLLT